MTATSQSTTGDLTDAGVWRDLITLMLTVGRGLEARLQREAGLSVPDYQILCALGDANGGRMRPRDLGLGLQWEKSRLSHQLRRMESRGLVGRALCDEDGRGALVAATAAGTAAYARAKPGYEAELHARFGRHLDLQERETLTALAHRVLSSVDPEEVCAPTGDSC